MAGRRRNWGWGFVIAAALAGLGCAGSPTAAAVDKSPWLAFGDSITQDAFSSPQAWNQVWAGQAPAVINAGARGQTSTYAAGEIRPLLASHPDVRRIGLAFGTNDVLKGNTPESFKTMMDVAIQRMKEAGATPMVATIPYSPLPAMQKVGAFNQALKALEQQHGLPAGPDLYTWFLQHPEGIGPDGVHMTTEGNMAIQRLWAEALQRAGG